MRKKQQQAARLQEDNARLVEKFSIEVIAAVAKVAKNTVVAFRNGAVTRPGPAAKIASALEKLKRGLTVADNPDDSYVLKGKAPWKGETTVEALTKERICGWCKRSHP